MDFISDSPRVESIPVSLFAYIKFKRIYIFEKKRSVRTMEKAEKRIAWWLDDARFFFSSFQLKAKI